MNIKRYIKSRSLLMAFILPSLTSCITLNEPTGYFYESWGKPKESHSPAVGVQAEKKQQIIVDAAIESTKMPYGDSFTFNNREFNNDCSGLIYGIFWEANIDLIPMISGESGNGVSRIYKVMDKKSLIHEQKLPNPGDLIFWSNTYGTWGKKPLSHIGVVVSVDEKTGQIEYVHNNTYLGAVRKENMNLYKPHETRPVNNYMRYDSRYKKTAAELFEAFGMAWKL